MNAPSVSAAAFTFPAVVLCCILAVANLPTGWLQGWMDPLTIEDAAPALAVAAAVRDEVARPRTPCVLCGVVEHIRMVDHGVHAAASYEFTVRMRDGSMRMSPSASLDGWRSGDRIMLIGGAPRVTP